MPVELADIIAATPSGKGKTFLRTSRRTPFQIASFQQLGSQGL
jgi:hypothetical protein